jgi:hypothetical protein
MLWRLFIRPGRRFSPWENIVGLLSAIIVLAYWAAIISTSEGQARAIIHWEKRLEAFLYAPIFYAATLSGPSFFGGT